MKTIKYYQVDENRLMVFMLIELKTEKRLDVTKLYRWPHYNKHNWCRLRITTARTQTIDKSNQNKTIN